MRRRTEQGEIAGLQYLRGFAALAVVTDHTFGATLVEQPKSILTNFTFLKYGALGVDLFFLISGFIICIIALQGAELLPTSGAKKFAQKRFVRIIPLMWLMITTYVIARYLSSGAVHAGSYLRAFLLLPYGESGTQSALDLAARSYFLHSVRDLLSRSPAPGLGVGNLAPGTFCLQPSFASDRPDTVLGQTLRIIANPVNAEFAAGLVLGIFWHRGGRKWSFPPIPATDTAGHGACFPHGGMGAEFGVRATPRHPHLGGFLHPNSSGWRACQAGAGSVAPDGRDDRQCILFAVPLPSHIW